MRVRNKLAAMVLAGLLVAAIPATQAAAVLPPTTVGPEGDFFSLSHPPGELIHERVSGTDTTCSAAARPKLPLGTNKKNQIPTAGNPTTDGPVVIPITR